MVILQLGCIVFGKTSQYTFVKIESYPRNTLIADIFFRAGFIEALGRGYETIRLAFEREKLNLPVFEQVRGGVLITIQREVFMTLQNHHGIDNVANNVVNNDVNRVLALLTDRQQNILKMIQANPYVSAAKMAHIFSVAPRTMQRELALLQKKELNPTRWYQGGAVALPYAFLIRKSTNKKITPSRA